MRVPPALGLGVGVLAISWGAPLARLTRAAPLSVAAWRMALAAVILLVALRLASRQLLPDRRRGAVAAAGVFLGLHFGTWIPSLWFTSVGASVMLVSTAPLFVLLASPRWLGVKVRRRNVLSFALALAGVGVIAWGDFSLSPRALLGDALAVAGAVCMAAYIVIGKRVRGDAPLGSYLAGVYGTAALILMATVLAAGVRPWPGDSVSWLPLLGMAVGPTLVGHSTLNWALAHLDAYKVNLAVLMEPVLATTWAWLVLREAPPLHVIPGAALVLAALAMEYAPHGDVPAAA